MLAWGGVFYKRILSVGSDSLKGVGFEIRVSDYHGVSHPLEFSAVWTQHDFLV